MKSYLFALALFCSLFSSGQTSNDTWSVKFSNAMTTRYTPTINALTAKGWEYSNTIITHGMEKVYNKVPDSAKYLNYIKAYVDAYVNGSGVISATINSLDRTHPGISCLFLYEKTGLAKYQTAATTLRNKYVGGSATFPKTAVGNIFWHKDNGSYNDIILIDGIYMLHPFLAKYGSMFGDNAAIDTAVNQTLYIYYQLYDNVKHLIKHAWNPTKTQAWANATTGNSAEVWSRGMGWYCMALVDILKYVPNSHPRKTELINAVANLAIGIQTYQDATTGLWYQVVDRGTGLAGNYLETSGSAMFVYMLKSAVDSGWISNSYLTVANKAWNYLKNTANAKISINGDTYPQINDFAPAMSVQTTPAGYAAQLPVDCPGTAHPHGYGAILMTASVMEFPLSLVVLPVKLARFTAQKTGNNVELNWENKDDQQIQDYTIERSTNGIDFAAAGTIVSTGVEKYRWTDLGATAAKIYYRISTKSLEGNTVLSHVVLVNTGARSGLLVSPNPVTGDIISISANGLSAGSYKLKLVNAAGIAVVNQQLIIGNEAQYAGTMVIPEAARGIYFLVLESGAKKQTRTILIQ